MKTLIISLPKAGTYLCSNLLVEFGIEQSYMHFNPNNFQKYKADKMEEARTNPLKFTRKLKFKDAITYLRDDTFAVSHLPFDSQRQTLLQDTKKILLLRDKKEIMESFERWNAATGRNTPPLRLAEIELWSKQNDVYVLSFNDMINKNIGKIDGLQRYLFGEIKYDSLQCITSALDSPSMTKMR
jgi:hypothetical protein